AIRRCGSWAVPDAMAPQARRTGRVRTFRCWPDSAIARPPACPWTHRPRAGGAWKRWSGRHWHTAARAGRAAGSSWQSAG
nr:hypothetical protein [Tanacetum cinerariifolium]